MTTRRILWALIGVLSVLVVVCSATAGWLLLRPRSAPIRLVVTSDDDRMRLIEADGTERVLDSKVDAQQFRFPAVSSDGRKLAYVVADGGTTRLMRLDIATGARRELYSSASRQPFDFAWSPDGRYLIFLAAGASGLTAYMVTDNGGQPIQMIATGQETYFAWSPDSSTVLLHLDNHMAYGGHLDVYATAAQRTTPLLTNPGFFQAPAWSVSGKHLFYVAQPPVPSSQLQPSDVQGDIVRVTAEGKEPQVLASEKQSTLRIVRAPTSDLIAYGALHGDEANGIGWGPLKLVDGTSGTQRALSPPDAHVAAFFWSPDSTRIAYLTYAGEFAPDTERTWHIVDVSSGAVQDLATFTPSKSLSGLEQFFDAYLYALSPWSPDGTRLAYGADDGVYVLDIASGKAARAAAGTMGVWVGKP